MRHRPAPPISKTALCKRVVLQEGHKLLLVHRQLRGGRCAARRSPKQPGPRRGTTDGTARERRDGRSTLRSNRVTPVSRGPGNKSTRAVPPVCRQRGCRCGQDLGKRLGTSGPPFSGVNFDLRVGPYPSTGSRLAVPTLEGCQRAAQRGAKQRKGSPTWIRLLGVARCR